MTRASQAPWRQRERRRSKRDFGLIFDLGMSEGNDTAFYLQKGFRVVGVEADPEMIAKLTIRFGDEIEKGSLTLLHRAASDTSGDEIAFFVCTLNQGVSGVAINPDVAGHYKEPCTVTTVDWTALLAHGRPYYVKIDIEGNEMRFLEGMSRSDVRPEFLSVECHTMRPVETLRDMGYRRFQLVDQNCQVPNCNSRSGFRLADVQREGLPVAKPDFHHASGPFGQDVFGFGDWLDFEGFKRAWEAGKPKRDHSWYDCHAWAPRRRGVLRSMASRLGSSGGRSWKRVGGGDR